MISYIFYYEGDLSLAKPYSGMDVIDARHGYLSNMKDLKKILKDKDSHQVLTNQVALLKNEYCWDKTTHRPNVLIKDREGNWKHITYFTDQKVKYTHNLEAMYRVGVFKI